MEANSDANSVQFSEGFGGSFHSRLYSGLDRGVDLVNIRARNSAVEYATFNRAVPGSNPGGLTTQSR